MRYKTGFTLIEMAVSVVVFLVLLSATYAVMGAGQNSFFTGSASVDLQQELRKFKESGIRDLIQGREATSNITNQDTIDFAIPANVIAGGFITWQNITYWHEPDLRQILRTPPVGGKVIANNITALNFVRDVTDSDLIYITVTSEKQDMRGRVITYSGDFDIKFRN